MVTTETFSSHLCFLVQLKLEDRSVVPRDVVRHMRSTVSPTSHLWQGWLGVVWAGLPWWLAPGAHSGLDAVSSQDSQCGTVIDVSIDCAVKLIGTNCIIYPVNSKDLQHIWVSLLPPLVFFLLFGSLLKT